MEDDARSREIDNDNDDDEDEEEEGEEEEMAKNAPPLKKMKIMQLPKQARSLLPPPRARSAARA